ncbi:MAG: sulfatase-like hydrolase/transferase [Bacteroidales bacterium]|nr:sulfatase-like hydrolase/transferase [Bacteroidales bacterium]
MKQIIISLIKQLVFLLLFFAFARLIFLIYYCIELKGIDFISISAVFVHSLKLDLSTACYILIFPSFLLFVQSLFNPKWINLISKTYYSIVIFIYSLISSAELGLYEEWKTKLNYKALLYLKHPGEVVSSVSSMQSVVLIALFLFQFIAGFYFYRKYFSTCINYSKRNLLFSAFFLIVTPVLLFIGLRGGTRQIPINQSESYFSKNMILNMAAVNSGWNIAQSILENKKYINKNPFIYFSSAEANKIVNRIKTTPKDTTLFILKTKKPNIILFILEGWSADVIESLGGDTGITPHFSEMEKEGILFTDFYASGARSEQGMAAIFGGFPSTPYSAITNQPSMFVKLPSFSKMLHDDGYKTSFYFGGQLIYGNIKGYILFNQFEKITEESDFPENTPKGKLGIHDEFVFDKMLSDLKSESQPFLYSVFTLSSHCPYDIPSKENFTWKKQGEDYIKSIHYADRCIWDFINEAKKQKWYKNTLFIFVSDHGHDTYKSWNFYSPQYHKIPLLLFGNVIKEECRGKQISKTGSQCDIPATLLPQFGYDNKIFKWSKNLLNPYCPEYAYFAVEDGGMGWIRPDNYFVWAQNTNTFYEISIKNSNKDSLLKEGKSYLQVLFQEYINY